MHISGNPHGYSLRPPGHNQSEHQHIVARSLDGELLEWYWTKEEGWQLVNLTTAVAGGRLIASDPHGHVHQDHQFIAARGLNHELLVWQWDGNGWEVQDLSAPELGRRIRGNPYGASDWMPKERQDVQHIVARGINGELLEWFRTSPRIDPWQVRDLSLASGQLIMSDPCSYTFGNDRYIVARSPDNRLLEWRETVVDLSAAVGGREIRGDPQGYSLGLTHHIARGPDHELLEWYLHDQVADGQRIRTLRVADLSAAVGGRQIQGDPYGYSGLNGAHHIVARGRNDELLEWFRTPQTDWQVTNLSAAVLNGRPIKSNPHGYTTWDAEERWLVQHVIARGRNDELLEWYWTPRDSWSLYNFGSTRGQWLEPVLALLFKQQEGI